MFLRAKIDSLSGIFVFCFLARLLCGPISGKGVYTNGTRGQRSAKAVAENPLPKRGYVPRRD